MVGSVSSALSTVSTEMAVVVADSAAAPAMVHALAHVGATVVDGGIIGVVIH